MSFGFVADITSISNAIHDALQRSQTLFFAAAANYGANEREMFPARHSSVISIRGTDADGQFLTRLNPPRRAGDGQVFGTLGFEVPSATAGPATEFKAQTGTSVATAVAAGMAAMFLAYVNNNAGRHNHSQVRDKLLTAEGMQGLFRSIGTQPMNEGYWYVAPWELENVDDDARWSIFVAAKPT